MAHNKTISVRRSLTQKSNRRQKNVLKRRLSLFLTGTLLLIIGYSLIGRGYQLPFRLPWGFSSSPGVQILPESFSQKANQFLNKDKKNGDLPLLLQTDERWGEVT